MAHRGAPPAAASEPLETSEQESVIAELRAQGRAHERFARRAFALVHAFAFCSVAFCANSLLTRGPFALEHQAYFGEELPSDRLLVGSVRAAAAAAFARARARVRASRREREHRARRRRARNGPALSALSPCVARARLSSPLSGSLSYLGMLVELGAAGAVCLGVAGARTRLLAGAAALVPALTWGPTEWRAGAPAALWWLPGGCALSFLVALYVDRDIASLLSDVEKLEGLKYDYKKV